MEKREILAFGQFRREERAIMARVVEQAACQLRVAESREDAWEYLSNHEPISLLVDIENAEGFAVQTRSSARFSRLPMLGLTSDISDLSFSDAFSWGADDLIGRGTIRPLLARLRALPKEFSIPPPIVRGNALIAEPEQTRRIVVGRVLRNAGYAITFAVTKDDAHKFCAKSDLSLAVVSSEFADGPRELIASTRASGKKVLFLFCAPPRNLHAYREQTIDIQGAGVIDAYAPPENVLFASNELGRNAINNRASPRILYGTTVAFRAAGRDADEHGFSYNVSAEGLYVRTLLPPEEDEIWLELRPPRSDRRVRLVGKVAWRQRFNHITSATVPPGFGIQITDAAQADVAAWKAGYQAILEALG